METEMHTKLSVATLDEDTPYVKVSIPGESTTAEVLLKKSAAELGIKGSSLRYVGLFEGLENPTRKFKDIDIVDVNATDLCIQKWCFDIRAEKKLLTKNDEAALKFLFTQAKADIKNGKLKPTEEQRAKLEENCDPQFPVPLQYINLCQNLEDYTSAIIRNCSIHKEFTAKSVSIPEGAQVTIAATRRGLRLELTNKTCFVSWRKVKSWTRAERDMYLMYEMYSVSNNNFTQLHIKTPQAPYLLAVTLEMIRILQEELDGPPFQTSDVKMEGEEGAIVAWSNVMFTTKRTALEGQLAEQYTDLSA
ncbi:sorting nexin-27-like isoform X2 [Ptychodera flava]|uniref:sorting nexin-27-like isoform X2 n=1 Tax=Ptychodera flava TaxID=63121 RepID=UPI003969E3F1